MYKIKKCVQTAAVLGVLCLSLTGCGSSNNSTSGNNDNNGIENAGQDIGNAVEDVADGVGDAVDDLVGDGGFNTYKDAHDYFLETMGAYHADASFELRNEDENLADYQEGSKGYHFFLYDTSKNESGDLFGEFYVDATSGRIYKKDQQTITEYPASKNMNSSTDSRTTEKAGSNGATTAQ